LDDSNRNHEVPRLVDPRRMQAKNSGSVIALTSRGDHRHGSASMPVLK